MLLSGWGRICTHYLRGIKADLQPCGFFRVVLSNQSTHFRLEQARKKTIRIWAEQSPFDLKDVLKRRGYRWCDGSDGRPRSWYIDVGEDRLEDEIAFLRTGVYLSEAQPRLQTLTALSRFSVRA